MFKWRSRVDHQWVFLDDPGLVSSYATLITCGRSPPFSSPIWFLGALLGSFEMKSNELNRLYDRRSRSYGSALIEARVELHIHYDRVDALASEFATICRDLDRFTRSDAPNLIALGRGDKSFACVCTRRASVPCVPTPGLPAPRPFPPEDRPPPFPEVDDGVRGLT